MLIKTAPSYNWFRTPEYKRKPSYIGIMAAYIIEQRTVPSPEVTQSDFIIEFNRVDLVGNTGAFLLLPVWLVDLFWLFRFFRN